MSDDTSANNDKTTWGRGGKFYEGPPFSERLKKQIGAVSASLKATGSAAYANPKVRITTAVTLGASVAIGGGYAAMEYFSTDNALRALDKHYEDKCYSFEKEHKLNTDAQRARAQKVLSLIETFGERGKKSAEKFTKDDAIICFGIDSEKVKPIDHWKFRDVYFSGSDYPLEMTALYMFQDDRNAYWSRLRPAGINQYVPQSSLIFSRAARSVYAVETVRDLYAAIDKMNGRAGQKTQAAWKTFLQESPAMEETLHTYLMAMNSGKGEKSAMQDAMATYMQDKAAIDVGDMQHMNDYIDHVRNLPSSEHTAIYRYDFDIAGSDYAFVDVDRDGYDDDLIRLNWQNDMTDYQLDATDERRLMHRKQKRSTCQGTNTQGDRYEYDCKENVSATVDYKKIPARETATVHLDARTLVDMAKMTGTDFLTDAQAQEIVSTTMEDQPDQLLYARALSSRSAGKMGEIIQQVNRNIPHHDTGLTKPGLGL